MTTEPSPLDSLRRSAEELVDEIGAIVPRLVGRSREQISIAMSFAERLPCADWFGLGGERSSTRPDLRVVHDDEDDDLPAPSSPAATTPAKKPPAKKAPAARKAPAKKAPAAKAPARKAPAAKQTTTSAATVAPTDASPNGELAIPDYDELAASQVIPRLDSLSADELESIRLHETSHRARRTILSRIGQLQAG